MPIPSLKDIKGALEEVVDKFLLESASRKDKDFEEFDRDFEKFSNEFLQAVHNMERYSREQVFLQRAILYELNTTSRVIGGSFKQIPQGDGSMLSITPGNSPKFQVTPTFSGPPFPLVGANASVSTSDSTNAPASIDPTDPTGATFILNLTAGAVIGAAGEPLTVTWVYTNTDGTTATVSGTVTEEGIVDDVTGGTFAQVV